MKPKIRVYRQLSGKTFRETFIQVKLQGQCTEISTVVWTSSSVLFQFFFLIVFGFSFLFGFFWCKDIFTYLKKVYWSRQRGKCMVQFSTHITNPVSVLMQQHSRIVWWSHSSVPWIFLRKNKWQEKSSQALNIALNPWKKKASLYSSFFPLKQKNWELTDIAS